MRLHSLVARLYILLFVLCCFGACREPAGAQGKKPNNGQPQSVNSGLTDSIPTPSQTVTDDDLNKWTNWNPYQVGTLQPNNPISSFGTLATHFSQPLRSSDMVIVHVVNSTDSFASSTIAIQDSSWFFFRLGKDNQFHAIIGKASGNANSDGVTAATLPTIYGIKNGYLITLSRLHLDPSRPLAADPINPPTLTYTITPTLGVPNNKLAAETIFASVVGITLPGAGGIGAHVEGLLPPPPPPPLIYLATVEITKLSSTDLKPPYSLAISATPVGTGTDSGTCQDVTAKTTCTLSQTVSVTDIEHWAIGVDIVAWGPLEKKYALSSADAVTMTSTRHEALIGTFDFSPWGSVCPMTKCPYIQGGLPLSGSALHLPYTGFAQPLPFTSSFIPLSIYGGVGFMKQTKLNGIAVGSTTTQTDFNAAQKTNWPRKYTFGIEVPVSTIASKIKSSIGGGSGGGGGGKGGGGGTD
jgi:hypothetical protein